MDIYTEYQLVKNEVNIEDIRKIVNICKSLGILQKIAYGSSKLFYKLIYQKENSKRPIQFAACIGLACKLLEHTMKYTDIVYYTKKETDTNINIMEDVLNLELQQLINLQFDINITDLYSNMQKICIKRCLRKSICRKAWVLLNDSIYLPFIMVFNSKVLINSLVVFACKLEHEDIDLKYDKFIIEEMIEFYENCK